jgi:hypothetical protein
MANVHKHNNCINIPSSQTFLDLILIIFNQHEKINKIKYTCMVISYLTLKYCGGFWTHRLTLPFA